MKAQAAPTKLEILLEHFERNGDPHHLCPYMVEFPDALRGLVRREQIDGEEAVALIEKTVESLVACSALGRIEAGVHATNDEIELWQH